MTNREYEVKCELQSLIEMRDKIEYYVSKLEMFRELATIVNPKPNDDVKIQKSKNIHKFEDDAIKIIMYEEKVEKKVKVFMDKIEQIELKIDMIPCTASQKILKDRYILGLKFEEISRNNNYELSYTFRLHKKGIQEMAKLRSNKKQ